MRHMGGTCGRAILGVRADHRYLGNWPRVFLRPLDPRRSLPLSGHSARPPSHLVGRDGKSGNVFPSETPGKVGGDSCTEAGTTVGRLRILGRLLRVWWINTDSIRAVFRRLFDSRVSGQMADSTTVYIGGNLFPSRPLKFHVIGTWFRNRILSRGRRGALLEGLSTPLGN